MSYQDVVMGKQLIIARHVRQLTKQPTTEVQSANYINAAACGGGGGASLLLESSQSGWPVNVVSEVVPTEAQQFAEVIKVLNQVPPQLCWADCAQPLQLLADYSCQKAANNKISKKNYNTESS